MDCFQDVTTVGLVGQVGPRDVLGAAAAAVVSFDTNRSTWFAAGGADAAALAVPALPPASILRGLFAAVASHCLARGVAFRGLLEIATGMVAATPGVSAATSRLVRRFLNVGSEEGQAGLMQGKSAPLKGSAAVPPTESSAGAALVYS